MSLRIRLPLDGNLENKGLNLITAINEGATIDSDGKTGLCYSFNGSTSYITVSGISDCFKGGTNPFSVSFWFYHTGNSRRGVLFGNYGLVSSNRINLEITAANKLRFWWDGSPDWTCPNFIVATQTWYHCVFVYDGSSVKLYINGELSDTRNGALTAKTPTGNYQIGRDSRTGATAFYGKMNEFRVYDHALSTKEIKEISRNLILHYKLSALNDSTIKNIVDCSGYGRDPSTIVGTINLTGDSVRQKDSIYLNGTGGIMSKEFYTPSTCSYCLWVNIPNRNSKFFIDARKSNSGVLPAYMSGSTFLVYSSLGGTNNHSITLPINTWFHLTVTLTPTTNKVYINGVLQASGTVAHGMNILTYITLGMRHSTATFMTGSINDFRMYAKELTPDDIFDIMTQASLDNKGNLFCYDLIEDDIIKINSTGIINSESLNEETLTGKLASMCKNGTFKVNEIIEK